MSARLPRVSVVVPVFNGARYLPDAIQSVLTQTYQEWEILLVDDGSTDESHMIVGRYVAAHPGKIRLISHPGGSHRGTASTRNLGIAHARGVYVANLDQDDAMLPTKLQEQVSVLDTHNNASMTFAPMILWRSWLSYEHAEPAADQVQTYSFPTGVMITPPDFLPLLLTGKNEVALI